MSKGKKKTSLIANLIIMIGLGIILLAGLQVAVLSQIAKKNSRQDHVENYVMLTTSIKESLERTIEGYFKQLNPYVNSDIMKSGNFDLVGKWLQQNPQIRAKEYDYVMIADAQGYSYNDNGCCKLCFGGINCDYRAVLCCAACKCIYTKSR